VEAVTTTALSSPTIDRNLILPSFDTFLAKISQTLNEAESKKTSKTFLLIKHFGKSFLVP
jgi:hypothetical protein